MSPWKSRWSWLRLVKPATSNTDAVDPVQGQRVAGDLHRADRGRRARRITASSACRSGASGVVRTLGDALVADPGLDRADQPGAAAGGPQRGVDQVRRGRLAVRAGDAEQRAGRRPGGRRPRPRPRRAPPAGRRRPARAGRPPAAATGRARRVGEHGASARGGGRGGERRRRARARPGSAAYRSPGRTARESRVTPGARGPSSALGRAPDRRRASASTTSRSVHPRRDRRAQPGRRHGGCGHGGEATGHVGGEPDRGRLRPGRRDLQLLQREGHDVLEHRRGDRAAEVAAARVSAG